MMAEPRAEQRCLVAIIGGGAAGLAAAIAAARLFQEQGPPVRLPAAPAEERDWTAVPVVLLERQDRVGKKILVTGNGRCNLSHSPLDLSAYHGQEPPFIGPALARFNVRSTLDWFRQLGLYHRIDPDGRVFPYSYQASAVLDLLRRAIDCLPAAILTNSRVTVVRSDRSCGFVLETEDQRLIRADRVILATGGRAAPAFGCDGDGYSLLRHLGHRLIEPQPALVQLCTDRQTVRAFAGIRVNGRATLTEMDRVLRQEDGEILFTEYGLSGPPILQLSRAVPGALRRQSAGGLRVHIDFLPDLSPADILEWFRQRRGQDPALPLQQCLTGLLHKKIGLALIKQASGLSLAKPLDSLDDAALQRLMILLKDWPVTVTGTRDWTQAQVTAGGIATADFISETMASRQMPGLYAAGEVLDVDGDCGGYNLQWAWSSGRLAGEAAAKGCLGKRSGT